MHDTNEFSLNKTQNHEHRIQCLVCAGKTAHVVLVSAEEHGAWDHHQYSVSWGRDHQVIRCLGCETISFRKEYSDEDSYAVDEDGDFQSVSTVNLYPPRLQGLKGLGNDTVFLPAQVQRVYDETLMALTNQAPVLAGIGLRALIESVCKEKIADGKDLWTKIEDLGAKQILTPSAKNILHKIRTLGNDAAHEAKPHTEKQLAMAMNVVEHLLRDVYILPKQVASVFED